MREWTSISQESRTRGIVERGDTTGIHLPFDHSDQPHTGIVGIKRQKVLNFVDEEAGPLRDNVIALTRE